MPRRATVKVVEQEHESSRAMEKMTFLIESDDLKDAYTIVGMSDEYKNVSEVIRAAVKAFIKAYYEEEDDDTLSVQLPPKLKKRLSLLVTAKEFTTQEDAVEYAVRELTKEYKEEIDDAARTAKKRKADLDEDDEDL